MQSARVQSGVQRGESAVAPHHWRDRRQRRCDKRWQMLPDRLAVLKKSSPQPAEGGAFDEATLDALEALRESLGVAPAQAAESIAKVVNAILVEVVDDAVTTLKSKEEKPTADKLQEMVVFMAYASSIFERLAPGVTIKPVIYSGGAKKGKIESVSY